MTNHDSTLSRRDLVAGAAALISLAAVSQSSGQSAAAAARIQAGGDEPAPGPKASHSAVLVTGGSGYIGGWCVSELLSRGFSVRTTIRNPAKESAVRAAVVPAGIAGERLRIPIADLLSDDGWDAAVAGCDYVLHVASPLGGGDPDDRQSLVAPARGGALRVLGAAVKAGVKRVVMTSAATAATPAMATPDRISDETTWFDPAEEVDAYRHSKRLAERAAWEFMTAHGGATELTTVLPGAVFGPVQSRDSDGSTEVIARLLRGDVPMNPRFGLQIVDVRDLADLHIRAMTSPRAGGERFLGLNEFMWMADISRALRAELGVAAENVPTRNMPDFMYRAAAMFDPALRAMTPRLGRMHRHTPAKAQRLLGWQPRPAKTTLVDCARSLIEHQIV